MCFKSGRLLAGGGEPQPLCQDDQCVAERVLARETICGRYAVVPRLGQTAKAFTIPGRWIWIKRDMDEGRYEGLRETALRRAGTAAREQGWRRKRA